MKNAEPKKKATTVNEAKTATPKKKKGRQGARGHRGGLFMAVSTKAGAVIDAKQLPVFWRKKMAQEVADKMGGKVVKVDMTWQMP